jgi:A/G-specific adenine glycosylase
LIDTPRRRAAVRRRLLDWYRRNRRDLPWRRSGDPYRVWISEVMLQQTTVRVVLPYYRSFLERFPDLETLAASPEENVLAAWAGLGYYHRARNLHRGAKHLAEHHRGRFPRSLDAALSIPGVGLYTASAVLSICFGEPLPVVDGNVRRVLSRLLALRGPEWTRDGPFYNRAEELLDRSAAGDWNQALMELGATVCTPRKPACAACPLRRHCRGFAMGIAEQLPEPRARRTPVQVTVAAALVERDGRVLLVQRPDGRLMARMWELPRTSLDTPGRPDLERELLDRYRLAVVVGPLVSRARHGITFRRLTLEGYAATLRRPPRGDGFRWATRPELDELPLSSMTRKLLKGLDRGQRPLPLE